MVAQDRTGLCNLLLVDDHKCKCVSLFIYIVIAWTFFVNFIFFIFCIFQALFALYNSQVDKSSNVTLHAEVLSRMVFSLKQLRFSPSSIDFQVSLIISFYDSQGICFKLTRSLLEISQFLCRHLCFPFKMFCLLCMITKIHAGY